MSNRVNKNGPIGQGFYNSANSINNVVEDELQQIDSVSTLTAPVLSPSL